MPKLIQGQVITIAAGRHQYPDFDVPDANDRITITLKRCTSATPSHWPNAITTLNLMIEVSFDGGATWQDFLGFGAEGGIFTKRDGTQAADSSATAVLPQGTGRKLRFRMDVANGPLVSQVDLEAN